MARTDTAIILAGGLGTRLKEAVPDLPKCMAEVAGEPFIVHVIRYLLSQGVEHFIISLGYKADVLQSFLDKKFHTLHIEYCIEEEPLGTGGAIQFACKKLSCKNVIVVNGDSIYKADLKALTILHEANDAACTLALKPMQNFDRYGVVEINENSTIKSFREKQYYPSGLINAGVYLLNKDQFLEKGFPEKFSFEKDFLEKHFSEGKMFGLINDDYFIDIGIPEDYSRAQTELKPASLDLTQINTQWTLFLDRDGVINHEKNNDYIHNWEQFRFYQGVLEAIKIFSKNFGRIIVVTNQRGVGRNIMKEEDLIYLHEMMHTEIESAGGRIDNIYYCTAIDHKDICRKPNPGMALKAKIDFPEINLSTSIMVGNKYSDMLFGRNAGMHTVYLTTTHPNQELPHPDIDMHFDSLISFAKEF
jgi:D-glycero-alpha-D-manno-heptose 1-phosphate guanylyltransferase